MSSGYKVMVDDNFQYMDERERWELGTYITIEGALAACRKLVDDWLAHNYKPGMTADELYDHFTSFGEEPFIMTPPGEAPGVRFSARDYVRERVLTMCGGSLSGAPDNQETSGA
jgi:hypothetical protein